MLHEIYLNFLNGIILGSDVQERKSADLQNRLIVPQIASIVEMAPANLLFDDLFFSIAQQISGIEELLTVFCDFLQRRTDFFHIMTTPNEKKGFPPGKAEEMLLYAFRKQQQNYLAREQPHLLSRIAEKQSGKKHHPTTKISSQQPQPTTISKQKTDTPQEGKNKETGSCKASLQDVKAKSPDVPIIVPNTAFKHVSNHPQVEEVTKQDNTLPVKKAVPSNDLGKGRISTWNGARLDKYWWSQSIKDVTIDVQLPPPYPVSKSRLKVHLTGTSLNVVLYENLVLAGDFAEPIILEDSTWCIEDGSRLLIVVEKARENWWANVIKNDPEIDLTKVESTRRLDDYDDETQASIRKVLFDRDQQALGMKTPEQMATEETLRKAWNAEGSPFKGTPFDPSMLNNGGSAMINNPPF